MIRRALGEMARSGAGGLRSPSAGPGNGTGARIARQTRSGMAGISTWRTPGSGDRCRRPRKRANSISIALVSKRKLAISARPRQSWLRPEAPTPLMRLRFGGSIGDCRPVGRPPDTRKEGRFGNVLTGCCQASIAVAVRLSTAFDGTLGAHLLHESDQGRERVRGPRANPPKIDGLIADYPCHRIDGVGNHSAYDFG